MAEKSRIKPERTETETDAALAQTYALLIRAGERASQAGIQNHAHVQQNQDGSRGE
jgi:hypothetical protein